MTYVSDTHSIIWFLAENARLSANAKAAFSDPLAKIVIPALVLAEIIFLQRRGRITVTASAVLTYCASSSNCLIAPFDAQVAQLLPANLDIHDGIIVATAIYHRDVLGEQVKLITKDTEIIASGVIEIVW